MFHDSRLPITAVKVIKEFIHFVGGNDPVIDRSQPARHDNANRTGVIESVDLIGQFHRYGQAFKFCPKTGPQWVAGIIFHCFWGRSLQVADFFSNVRNEFFKGSDRLINQTLFMGVR